MRIATWNLNSIKARGSRLLAWLERTEPDIVCLQELKCTEESFPDLEIRAAGYRAAAHCQKTYNGVAILTREEAKSVVRGMDDAAEDTQARLIAAEVHGLHIISAYFPNGQRVGSEKFAYKLRWMERLRAWLDRTYRPTDPVVLAGDFNVAPDDKDVARPEEWADTVLCHPDARRALEHVREFGFIDVVRAHHPEGGPYSWWDYRQLGFPKGNGLRIDHIFATEAVAARTTGAHVDRDERKGKSPSDHAPVVVELTSP